MEHSVFNQNPMPKEAKKNSVSTQQTEQDELYERFIDSEIEGLLESDETYQFQSTPLKTAKLVKEEHRRQLHDELEQKEMREHIAKAYELIMSQLPQRVSPEEFKQLKQEFAKSAAHFVEISQKPPEFIDQIHSWQEVYGISDQSMMLIYSLAYSYLENQDFKDAESLLYFLNWLNPGVSSFWMTLGICLQSQSKHEEAKIMFEVAQTLDPMDPNAFILGAQTDIQLKNRKEAEEQLKSAEKILNTSNDIINKQDLINMIIYLKNNFH